MPEQENANMLDILKFYRKIKNALNFFKNKLRYVEISSDLKNLKEEDYSFDYINFIINIDNNEYLLFLIDRSEVEITDDELDLFKNILLTETPGVLNHRKVMNIIGNSKLVICTSYYDASPNTLKEALSCGSNILLSKNCGWSEIYPKEFVCSDVYNFEEWKDKASYLVKRDVGFNIKLKKARQNHNHGNTWY